MPFKSKLFRFEARWALEPTFEPEVTRCWNTVEGNILIKLNTLRIGLSKWARQIQKEIKGLKEELIKKLESLVQIDCNDDVLQEMMETKLQLNWEVNKDEIFWEQW